MADQDSSRLQESLLPIGQNAPPQTTTLYTHATTTTPYSSVGSGAHNQAYRSGQSWDQMKKFCWWFAVIFTVVLVFLVISLKLFWFKPISKDPPELDNSTATEPNTRKQFRLLMEGPRNRVQSLVGVTLWTHPMPIPTRPKISVAAVGLYVDRAEGKRRLRRFRNHEMNDDLFGHVKDALVRGGMTETLRVIMATTPPGKRMMQWWGDHIKPILERVCPAKAEAEFQAFSDFFPNPFQKGDEFYLERREGEDLYGYREASQRPKAARIGGNCLARAMFEAHLDDQKTGLVNLLDEFFER